MVLAGGYAYRQHGLRRTVVHSLKVIHQRKDVLVTHGDLLQDCDLVAHLNTGSHVSQSAFCSS
jgi:hypothetical protein